MKIVKGIGKAVKGILKGVTKVFKKVVKSKLFKVALIGAAIYFGGAYLGAWGGPSWMPTLAGAAAPGAAAAGTGAVTTGLAPQAAIAGEALAPGVGAAGAAAAPAAAPLISAGGTAAEVALTAAPVVAPAPAAAPGFFSSPLAKYGLISAGAGALQGAFTPDAIDVEKERAKQEREQAEWRRRFLAPNFLVGDVNVGQPTGQPLRDTAGQLIHPSGQPPVNPNALIRPRTA